MNPISRNTNSLHSFVTEAKIVQEEGYKRMKQAGELDKDSLRKRKLSG